jgi:hypothetical protein
VNDVRLSECPDPACDLPAEVVATVVLGSTAGPVEMGRTRCVRRHVYVVPVSPTARSLASHSAAARAVSVARAIGRRTV